VKEIWTAELLVLKG